MAIRLNAKHNLKYYQAFHSHKYKRGRHQHSLPKLYSTKNHHFELVDALEFQRFVIQTLLKQIHQQFETNKWHHQMKISADLRRFFPLSVYKKVSTIEC